MEPTMTPSPSTPPAEEAATLPVLREHIAKTPGTAWGKPRIAGTRIKVEQVVIGHEREGMSPGEIVSKWPHLTLADVHAALAYDHDYREEVEADLAEGEKRFEELKAKQPSLLERIGHRKSDAPDDSLPPG